LQPLFDDVTVPQLVLLDAVQACGREGIAAISAYTLLSQPTVTQHAAGLEAAGLLRRIPADDDRRRRVLTLTERGEHLLAAKRGLVQEPSAIGSTTWEGDPLMSHSGRGRRLGVVATTLAGLTALAVVVGLGTTGATAAPKSVGDRATTVSNELVKIKPAVKGTYTNLDTGKQGRIVGKFMPSEFRGDNGPSRWSAR
jgi:DNA-binding MarR family transcriptional regulator